MSYLSAPYITLGLGALALGALFCPWVKNPRAFASAAALTACISFLFGAFEVASLAQARLLDPWLVCFTADALDAVPMAFFAALTIFVIVFVSLYV